MYIKSFLKKTFWSVFISTISIMFWKRFSLSDNKHYPVHINLWCFYYPQFVLHYVTTSDYRNKLGFSKSSHWFCSILWSFFFFNVKIKARYNKDHRFCFCTLEFSGSIGHTLVVGSFVCKMGHGWHGDHHLRSFTGILVLHPLNPLTP